MCDRNDIIIPAWNMSATAETYCMLMYANVLIEPKNRTLILDNKSNSASQSYFQRGKESVSLLGMLFFFLKTF